MSTLIGIDPDSEKSGVAVWDNMAQKLTQYTTLGFFELFDLLRSNTAEKVFLESGWQIKKSNWHNERLGVCVASRIGAKVGANHQVGKLIEQMCKYLGISCTLVLPQGKMDSKNFEHITGIKRSNQDERDSIMLVWGR